MSYIKLEKITAGSYWLQVDLIDFRMMCGCPADSIKFLLGKGYVKEQTVDGRKKIIGPNAILLSDKPVQQGRVSNFSEFPIMHMFYIQGMLAPSSLSYGQIPYFIGDAEIIKSQIKYLTLGNYGITNMEKLAECYPNNRIAKDIMAMKLHFAFGEFTSYKKTLKTIPVEGKELVEIVDGLKIKRVRPNVFEISFKSERVTIDLNLKPDETYSKTFTLEKKKLPKASFAVVNTGSGDGWSPDKPCFGSMLIMDEKKFLIDAGPNISFVLEALGTNVDELEGVFLTHVHDDHFCGFESLWYRKKPLNVYLVEAVRITFRQKLASVFCTTLKEVDKRFKFIVMPFHKWTTVQKFEVFPIVSPHAVETSAFHFRKRQGDEYRSYAHMGDLISFRVLEKMATSRNSKFAISKSTVNKVTAGYLTSADFKKIDIGGGIIHGDAENFRNDTTPLKSLGHINRALTAEEKKIGILEPFGSTQIIIP